MHVCVYRLKQPCALLQVICIEPFFDAYLNAARLVSCEVVGVPLRPAGPSARDNSHHWHIYPKEFEAAITPKTKMVRSLVLFVLTCLQCGSTSFSRCDQMQANIRRTNASA